MEKETLGEKGVGLPIHAALSDGPAAAPVTSRRSKHLRLAAGFALVFLLGTSAFSFAHRRLQKSRSLGLHASLNPDLRGKLTVDEAESHYLTIPDEKSAIATSKLYATLPHLAGSDQDFTTAKYFLELLQSELGITPPDEAPVFDAGSPESQDATLGIISRSKPTAWIDKYFPVMNTPLGRALDIVDDDGVAVWKANTEEPAEEGDPAGVHAHDIGAWHGLSAPGDVTGKAVYVNYGRKKDFDDLVAAGVNFTGTIAVVRYGAVFRGLKIKAAQEAGCIGTLIYTDPRDHGSVTEEAGYKPYPEGPAIHPDSVQRGSVQFLSSYPGDPTTPGFPAYENATRLEGGNVPQIPSLPISWNNGKRILEEINPTDLFKSDGTLSKRSIRLLNQVDNRVIPIWNTIGVIPGHIKDEIVVLGNHRDAWVNGAGDPTSGTVSVVEIIRGLGSLLRKGWTPLRTIVIASWDAEEYGLIGSTEYGEDFADFISKYVVAYLNVDVSSSGSRIHFSGSPSLAHLIRGVAQNVPHPTDSNRTLWDAREDSGPFASLTGASYELGADLLNAEQLHGSMNADPRSTGVSPLGSGSDFTVFLQRIGIASIDGGFGATPSDAVYHYHSVYDSVQWQERYADPGFHRHVAVSKYLGLVTLRIADSIILPINTTQYTLELESYLSKVEDVAAQASPKPDLAALRKAINKLQKASEKLDYAKFKAEKKLRKALLKTGRRKHRAHHRRMCAKRRFKKFRNWVKSVFGVPPTDEHTHRHVESSHEETRLHKRELEGESPGRGPLHPQTHEARSGIERVRLGLAAGGAKWGGSRRAVEERKTSDEQPKKEVYQRRGIVDELLPGLGPKNGDEQPKKDVYQRDEDEPDKEDPSRGIYPNKRSDAGEDPEKGQYVRRSFNGETRRRGGCKKGTKDVHGWLWTATPDDSASRKGPHGKLAKAALAVRRVNKRLAKFESGFISEGGIKDREWYRHLGVAPGKWLGYGATTFPALTEALDENNSTLATFEADRLADLVFNLADSLKL